MNIVYFSTPAITQRASPYRVVLLIVATQRVVMLGLNAAGKPTIISHLNMGSGVFVKPTIGFNVEELKVSFVVWDLACQTFTRVIWRQYLRDIAGLIYVVESGGMQRNEVTSG